MIQEKIEKVYSNQIKNIKKLKGKDKRIAIGSLICDVGDNCINALSKIFSTSWRYIKKCFYEYLGLITTLEKETRGRKSKLEHYPNLKNDIEKVIDNYKHIDSHFKKEIIYVSITPDAIINELVNNYGYKKNFACYNTIDKLLKEMGYILHKIPKTQVLDKIAETDAIFENVNEHLEDIQYTDDTVAAISIDDKAVKKIGKISDNGYTRLDIKALDHDTNFECSLKPFGILDLKTNETFVTCTPYTSTADFKVDCIEEYIRNKTNIKKLIIFLDNGPENSGIRKLWLSNLVKLSIKYNIIIDLVYYPPYHSKYNKIEHYWGTLQKIWRNILITTKEMAIECINRTTWNGVKSIGKLSNKEYQKGKKVTISELELIDNHIIREEGLEKWSIIITP